MTGLSEELKHWSGGRPVETIRQRDGEKLPDIDELNARVLIGDWELGIDGAPRPPWQLLKVVSLVDPTTGIEYSFESDTKGAAAAFADLRHAVRYMSGIQHKTLQGAVAIPLVKLASVPMPTKFGMRKRPDFVPINWWWFRPSAEKDGAPALEKLPPLSFGDELDDRINY